MVHKIVYKSIQEVKVLAYINFGSRTLEAGLSGTDVELLQWQLNHLPDTIVAPINVDGVFGEQTRAAIKQIQEYFGLTVDKIVSNNTYLFLGQLTSSYVPSGARVFGSRTLKRGSRGFDVWVLQNRLVSTKKTYAQALKGPADSIFSVKTESAVKLFQADHGLKSDGVVGSKTFYALFLYTNMGGRYLEKDRFDRSKGYDVYGLQSNLMLLGHYSGNRNGFFDETTEAAVKKLQKDAAILIDGVVGPQTYFYLAPQ